MQRSEHLVVDSRLEALNEVQTWFNHLYDSLEPQLDWIKGSCDRLNIAVAEGFTNAVRHAHAKLPPETPIKIEVALGGDQVNVQIWDYGYPFDPQQLPEPEPGSLLCDGGYGWFLLKRVVDHVAYQRQGDQNCLKITQHRSTD